MRRLIYRLTHRTERVVHPIKGFVLLTESRRLTGRLTNLCVWDGTTWHQAPLDEWENITADLMWDWSMSKLPADAFDDYR